MNDEMWFEFTGKVTLSKTLLTDKIIRDIKEGNFYESELYIEGIIQYLRNDLFIALEDYLDNTEGLDLEIEPTEGLLQDIEEVIKEVRKELNT